VLPVRPLVPLVQLLIKPVLLPARMYLLCVRVVNTRGHLQPKHPRGAAPVLIKFASPRIACAALVQIG